MKNAIVVDFNDIKQMLAERFNVPPESIIKNQYSFTVIIGEDNQGQDNDKS